MGKKLLSLIECLHFTYVHKIVKIRQLKCDLHHRATSTISGNNKGEELSK
ncbi:hypothetical protein BACCIP111895_02989 [Neobacillus rhizosphaerae]|uniref:Uncharacterized protein n=1 Tax=Neobacillus rhizosphaerae TaxID=2880965 RepID=A0ABM9ET47_9BACI|nr:hypothetical protein BACCIP111895_02989 [Neobacillus rhizosphaerae]